MLLKIVNAYKNPSNPESTSDGQLLTDDILVATDRLESIVERIYNESGRIEQVSDNVLNMSENIVRNQTETLDGVETLTHYLQTVQHRAEDTSAQAKIMREINASLERDIDLATNALTNTSETFSNLTANTRRTSESIHFFLEQMQHISEIQQMLKNIVEQTNLLALNASIESNRAGEHGRTFSNVAHRIQDLADEGKQNLLKIDPLMNSIQQASNEVLGVLKESQEWIAVNKEELEEARRSLGQVQGQFNVLEQMISENEASCIKQVEIVQNMTGELSHLLHKSRESTQLATDVQAISSSQNGIVEQLLEASKHLTHISDEFSEVVKHHADAPDLLDNPQLTIDMYAQWKNKLELWASHPQLITSPPELLQSIFQAWMEETDELEAVWLNQTNGDFLHSLPPAGIINAKRRPWFAGALQDGFYISAPYVSAITKRPCVTISILLKDSDGTPQGILGTDIRCHMI